MAFKESSERIEHMIKKIIICLSLWLIAVSCVKKEEAQYPILGIDPLYMSVMEEPDEALTEWAKKGVKNAILVHISPYDSLKGITHHNIQKIAGIMEKKKWEQLNNSRGRLFNNSNYLYAAAQLEMVKRIYWVIPYRFFEDIPLAGDKIKEFLKKYVSGFEEKEIDLMKMTAGCLTGILSGADINICSPRTVPEVREPVTVSVDVSFFPVYAAEARISKLRALKWFFDYITLRRTFRVIHSNVSYGIESGYTDAIHRYIGDEIIEVMSNPQILKSDSPPELWQFRDKAENMLSGGEDELIVEYLDEPFNKYPDDPALLLLNAAAEIKLKKYDHALKSMDDICQKNEKYCYGYIYLGEIIDNKENVRKETFFKRASDALPDSKYVNKKVSELIKAD